MNGESDSVPADENDEDISGNFESDNDSVPSAENEEQNAQETEEQFEDPKSFASRFANFFINKFLD